MSFWLSSLAEQILEDRVDRGITPEDAGRRALAYERWLEDLAVGHDRERCALEPAIARWRGDLGFHAGQATVLVAGQGFGKTNACSFLIEHALAHRPTWDVYTNIPFAWDVDARIPRPPRLFTISSMRELLRGVATSGSNDRIPAICVDEMDQVTTSHSWSNDPDESWTKFLYVERHFRVRGPLLAYHVYEHVPQPLRRVGDLRGSYFRVVRFGKDRKLACVEDRSRWWAVGESRLPFLTLGLRGFSIDVDMAELEATLSGNHKQVARQILEYLDTHASEADQERARRSADEVRLQRDGVDEFRAAANRRRQRIVAWWLENPDGEVGDCIERFRTSRRFAVEAREYARQETVRKLGEDREQGAGSRGT